MHVTFAKCGNAARCEAALGVGTTYSKHARFRDSRNEIEAKYWGCFFSRWSKRFAVAHARP